MPRIDLPSEWTPRAYQEPAWQSWLNGCNRQLLVWHRRAGKDDINLRMHSVGAFNRVGTYWHMLPEYSQARKAIWDAVNPNTGKRRIDEAFPQALRENTRESDMFIRFKNGSTWQVVGSDNFNALIGTPPVGLTASEWALANPMAWAYLAPILAENGGWASFISTPRGNNHLKSMLDRFRNDAAWFTQVLTARDTGAISDDAIEAQRAEYEALFGRTVADLLVEQEFFCSFAGATVGAYWGAELATADVQGRIGVVPVDWSQPVHTAWDLGDDLIDVCVGKRFRVSMTPKVHKLYQRADAASRARVEKWMSYFAEDGHEFLDDQKLKYEGKFPSGKIGIANLGIWAFKARHLRVYGGVVNGDHFVATAIDIAKKQDAADQDTLKSAAKKLAEFV